MVSKPTRSLMVLLIGWITLGCVALASPTQPPPAHDAIATSAAETLVALAGTVTQPALSATLPMPVDATLPVEVTPAADAAEAGPGLIAGPGLTIAYVDPGRNLWVSQPDSSPRQLTSSGDVDGVQISDDAAWIAFLRTPDYMRYGLWVIRSDGSGERAVMDALEFEALPRMPEAVSVIPASFGWAPRSHRLVYTTRPIFEGPGLLMNDDLWIADADSSTRSEVLPAGSGGQFVFSPDGAQIALVQPTSISLVNSDGTNRRDRIFTYSPVITYSEYQYYADPQWAPDSSYLEVVVPPAAALDRPEEPAVVWRISLDGTPAVSMGSFATAPLLFPVLAPNLERLAYLRAVGAPADNRRELRIAAPDGAGDGVYQEEFYITFHSWAPDASRFLFSEGEDARLFMGVPGEVPQPVGDWAGASQVRWVDSARFLFVIRDGGNVELRLRAISGEETLIGGFPAGDYPFLPFDFGG